MTERLYYTSDVLVCTARIVRYDEEADGRYAIVLDKTVFHPQGGGQPADQGWINGITVENVVQQGDDVKHIVAQWPDAEEVALRVDAEIRMLHANLHSAGHLLGCAGELYGWQPVKAHHWPGEGRITFAAGENATVPDASTLEEQIARWRSAGLERHIEFENGRRKVRFGDLPAYACGGTHLPSLSVLGEVVMGDLKVKKGQLVIRYSVV